MAKIMVAHQVRTLNEQPIETYGRSWVHELRQRGHSVIEAPKTPPNAPEVYKEIDLLLDIDSGRDRHGNLRWHGEKEKPKCKSAVYFIDSHGYPSLHKRTAKNYDHVFFAVWDKRDLFTKHDSAHWCPNFTDLRWFDGEDHPLTNPRWDFGFFGSKGGLDRADTMLSIANDFGWKATASQVSVHYKHRWPATAEAMAQCRVLFNHGQKHDCPNLRVIESMAMQRPLITGQDPRTGLEKLFKPWVDFIPYEAYTFNGLPEAMKWSMENPNEAASIADNAYANVAANHTIKNRVDQVLEVCKIG